MSDARPITNITDFVCSACWTGFSRSDAGVVQGDRLICPHCGAPVPTDEGDDQVASAVRNAPRVADRDSSEFQVHSFRDTSDFAPTPDGAGPVDSLGGWLPPEQRNQATQQTPRPVTDSDDFDEGFDGGVLVGDPDHDFSVAERTLSGSDDDNALLEALRQTSPIPKAFVVGEELSIATDEPTPVDITAMTDMDEAAALADLLEAPLPEMDLAHRDWKLKAMGITYNFHGLDPLFSWAANKSGQPMSLSHDGETWKDFHTFYASIRDGVSVKKAFENAPDPSNAPPPPTTPRVTRTINQLRPELPELEGLRPPVESAPKDLGPSRTPSTTGNLVSRATTNPANQSLQGASQPSGSAIRPAAVGTTSRSQASLSPSSSPSKRMPVANIEQKALFTPPRIAAVAVVLVLAILAALHFTGVFKIPGLP